MKGPVLTALAVLGLDQVSKQALRLTLPPGAGVTVLPVFSLVHVQNTGAAFGILPQANAFFVAATLVILGVLVKKGRELSEGVWSRAGLSLVWGGALGNLVDRLWWGAVTDFLDFHLGGWHWPAFNVADSAITTGIACLIVQQFVPRPLPRPTE